ncbi:MAG: T9SS type A sorting domain-containing protein [Bacteroidota bacterium]
MKHNNLFLNSITTVLLLLALYPAQASIHYVTPSGAGSMNGSSWANAAYGNNLQLMIDAAVAGDEVWVACGTYVTTTSTNRTISFEMRNDVAVYGSFQGTETSLSQRTFTCGPCSILSGEIGAAGISDNSYKIVYNQALNSSAVLDGFVIRDANDNRTPSNSGNGLGGGMYNNAFGAGAVCNPTVRNCLFTNNRASWGGGAFNNGYTGGSTEPTYINCIFYQNHATIEAGGMDSYGVAGNASPTLFNCIFYGNTSATNVGAMYAWGGNTNGHANPVLINCLFANNVAQNGYGGAFIADNHNDNDTASSGSSTVSLHNCIVWNNTATGAGQQFYVKGNGAEVIATYSDIDLTGQTAPHILAGVTLGNLNQNPSLVNISSPLGADACWMTADDGLRLQASSICIDAGNNNNVFSKDILGNMRINGTAADMGPYEFTQTTTGIALNASGTAALPYPNPAYDCVTITADFSMPQRISVSNVLGQVIDLTERMVQLNAAEVRVNMGDLPTGMYFVKTPSASYKIYKK